MIKNLQGRFIWCFSGSCGMRLTTIVLALGVSSCAGYMQSYDMGCHSKHGMTMCTDDAGVSYFTRSNKDRKACGVRELYSTHYATILDEGCDGTADVYQEGNDESVFVHLWRKDDEERFLKFDERLKEVKAKWE